MGVEEDALPTTKKIAYADDAHHGPVGGMAIDEKQSVACFDLLPPELQCHILEYVVNGEHWPRMVYKHVCHQWKGLMDAWPVAQLRPEATQGLFAGPGTTCNLLAYSGQLPCLQWAVHSGYAIKYDDAFYHALSECHLETMQWVHKKMVAMLKLHKLECSRLFNAAANNRLDIFEWLKSVGIAWREDIAMRSAARHGHNTLMEFFLDNGATWYVPYCEIAAHRGNISILELARKRNLWCDIAWCLSIAAQEGHSHVIKWAFSLPDIYEVNDHTSLCYLAARAGLTDQLEILTEQYGCPLSIVVFVEAARGGHIETMVWLKNNGCLWNAAACASAAAAGQLEALQWLREHGCPWNRLTCADAAATGQLEVLQWARENGCPWDKEQCLNHAILFDKHNVIAWIQNCH